MNLWRSALDWLHRPFPSPQEEGAPPPRPPAWQEPDGWSPVGDPVFTQHQVSMNLCLDETTTLPIWLDEQNADSVVEAASRYYEWHRREAACSEEADGAEWE